MTGATSAQRRGRAIAMNQEELDRFLHEERMCRVASLGSDGEPHNSPLWFAWDGTALWLNSIVKSQRWTNLERDPRVSVVIDAGSDFSELRGVELTGAVETVGDVPRMPGVDDRLAVPERLFGDKYGNGTFAIDGRHAWLRLSPQRIVTWDFRKMGR